MNYLIPKSLDIVLLPLKHIHFGHIVLRKQQDFHSVIGVITLPNEPSVQLHEQFGLKKVGHFTEVGKKFGALNGCGVLGVVVRSIISDFYYFGVMKMLLLLFAICASTTSLAQLKWENSFDIIPRSKTKGNPDGTKLDKITFNGVTYYMIRFHDFSHFNRHEHPDMVPYCDHPLSYIERYYIYVFDEKTKIELDDAYTSNQNYTLNFIAEGSFEKEYQAGETAGVFNWPNIKTNKAIKEIMDEPSSSTSFTFDFDQKIQDFTPIHWNHFNGDVWIKNKKFAKFLVKTLD